MHKVQTFISLAAHEKTNLSNNTTKKRQSSAVYKYQTALKIEVSQTTFKNDCRFIYAGANYTTATA